MLVNNSANRSHKPLLELSEQEWRSVIDTNLTGLFFCSGGSGELWWNEGVEAKPDHHRLGRQRLQRAADAVDLRSPGAAFPCHHRGHAGVCSERTLSTTGKGCGLVRRRIWARRGEIRQDGPDTGIMPDSGVLDRPGVSARHRGLQVFAHGSYNERAIIYAAKNGNDRKVFDAQE